MDECVSALRKANRDAYVKTAFTAEAAGDVSLTKILFHCPLLLLLLELHCQKMSLGVVEGAGNHIVVGT